MSTAVYLSVDGGKQWAKVSGERGETGEQVRPAHKVLPVAVGTVVARSLAM